MGRIGGGIHFGVVQGRGVGVGNQQTWDTFAGCQQTDRAAFLSLAETATPILVSFMFSYPLWLMLRAVMGRLRSRDFRAEGCVPSCPADLEALGYDEGMVAMCLGLVHRVALQNGDYPESLLTRV